MARALFLLVVGLLGNLVASSSIPEEELLKNINVHDEVKRTDIANLDFVFAAGEGLALKSGHGKDKKERKERKKDKKSKKPSSGEADDGKGRASDDRRTNRLVGAPDDQIIRQQDALAGKQTNRHISREETAAINEEAITVRGPIRRKPLIFPHDS